MPATRQLAGPGPSPGFGADGRLGATPRPALVRGRPVAKLREADAQDPRNTRALAAMPPQVLARVARHLELKDMEALFTVMPRLREQLTTEDSETLDCGLRDFLALHQLAGVQLQDRDVVVSSLEDARLARRLAVSNVPWPHRAANLMLVAFVVFELVWVLRQRELKEDIHLDFSAVLFVYYAMLKFADGNPVAPHDAQVRTLEARDAPQRQLLAALAQASSELRSSRLPGEAALLAEVTAARCPLPETGPHPEPLRIDLPR